MADIPRGTSTNAEITFGETFRSRINDFGDRDWIRVDTKKGDWIEVNLFGRGDEPLEDAFVKIYDKDRLLVTEDDDSGANFDARVTFQATKSGPYYIEAAGLDGDYIGQYGITAEKVDAPEAQESLYWGTALDDTNVSYYFAQKDQVFNTEEDCGCDGECSCGNAADTITAENWKAFEKDQFEAAFDDLAAVSGLAFNEVNNAADADFVLIADRDELDPDTLGFFNPPGYDNPGVGVFNVTAWDRDPGGNLREGGFGFVTIVHELLHGLGLAHPHDDGGGSLIMPGVTSDFDDFGNFDLNQGIFTTMSYNSGYFTGTTGSAPSSDTFGYESGPMALDIAVLQTLYGTGGNHKNGNSTYALTDQNKAGAKWQAIWDTGGTDQITYDGDRDTTIDLRAATLIPGVGAGGFVSAAKGIAGGYTIAHGAVIENARSGAGDDTLIGNGADNKLTAGRGDDALKGRGGDDHLSGGKGWDVLNGGEGQDKLTGGEGQDRLNGAERKDVLDGGTGKDRLKGGGADDTLRGGADGDLLKGGTGDDTLNGGANADDLRGGGGADMLTGGKGADDFTFTGVSQSGAGAANRDIITDFGEGLDLIDLSAIDADAGRGGNQAFDFIGNDGFSDAGQLRVVKQGADRLVQADRNGDGQADLEILLLDAAKLNAGDFIL